jgi:alpha-tubulin suppressor-like RCC1 family protein
VTPPCSSVSSVCRETDVATFAGGDSHIVALRQDGTAFSWGIKESGQTNVPAGLSAVVAIGAGTNHSLALKSDGHLKPTGPPFVAPAEHYTQEFIIEEPGRFFRVTQVP